MRTGAEPARGRTARPRVAVFSRIGPCWTVVFEGRALHMRDREGLRHVVRLLEQPGESIAAIDLAAGSRLHAREAPAGGASRDPARARVAVTKRIREVIRTISTEHPSLGYHLETAIKTGERCSYQPDPTRRVAWRIEGTSTPARH